MPLPTIIIVHPRERASKCTVEPLRRDPRFHFETFHDLLALPTGDYVRLGVGGEPLSSADAERGLLVLDGTWRLADRMEKFYAALPVRSISGVVTAYPRVSRNYGDPEQGLATIEAIYAAYRILGRECESLLADYHWAERFRELNGW